MARARSPRRLVALCVVAMIALAGCSAPKDTEVRPTTKSDIAIAQPSEPTSLNPFAEGQDQAANVRLSYLTHETFAYVDRDMEVVADEGFGKVEKISDDPLTVRYTLKPGLKWSDGKPITTDDLLLGWAAASGYFDDATIDASSGAVTSGTRYFHAAAAPAGLGDTLRPMTSADKLTLTLVYRDADADWNLQWLLSEPIHVVAARAGVTVSDLAASIRSTPRGDPAAPATPNATLLAAAGVWNDGFVVGALPDDASLYVSNGPYVLDSWTPGESITLVRNPNYAGTRQPSVDTITLRFAASTATAATMLRSGSVDIVQTDAVDGYDDLAALKDVQMLSGSLPRAYYLEIADTGTYADPDVREAVMKTVPRQSLTDDLLGAYQTGAAPLNSLVYFSSPTSAYQQATAQNDSGSVAAVDVSGAKSLLADRAPALRIRYDADDASERAMFAAMQKSAVQAGFRVSAVTTEDADAGTYDAQIVQRSWRGFGGSAMSGMFAVGGAARTPCIADADIDELAETPQTLIDPVAITAANVLLDKALFTSRCTLPLLQDVGIAAFAEGRVSNVTFMGGTVGVLWNFWEWNATAPQ